MTIVAKGKPFLEESFTASRAGGKLILKTVGANVEKQARGFWDVAWASGHGADYLGVSRAKFPLRAVWWQGDQAVDSMDDELLSCGFNALVCDHPSNLKIAFRKSTIAPEPDEVKTTAERLLEDMASLEGDAPAIYLLPREMNPEWYGNISEDVPANVVIAFDAEWDAFWDLLRKEAVPSKTPLMPMVRGFEKISIISRCYRHPFVGVLISLNQWPEDTSGLWAAGFSQWLGLSPEVLAETWHKRACKIQ